MEIKKAKVFKTEATIRLDNTAYGNRYWMQFEDDKETDHHELNRFCGKRRKVTVIIEDLDQGE